MSEAAYIDQAVTWSKDLTRMKARGPGDTENAMRRVEREYGIDFNILHTLRYRRDRVRDIGIALYHRIHAAYQAECERQMRKLAHEVIVTKALTGPANAAVVAAETVVREAMREDKS